MTWLLWCLVAMQALALMVYLACLGVLRVYGRLVA